MEVLSGAAAVVSQDDQLVDYQRQAGRDKNQTPRPTDGSFRERTALMRKVTLGLANSLDNYIARKDGGFDWLHWSKEVAEISARFMKTVDALLIGRRTYDGMLAFGQTSYPGAKNYVFTRSKQKVAALKKKLTKKPDQNVEII